MLVKNVTAPENESIRGLKTGLLNHIRFQGISHSLKLALKENCYLDIEFSSNVVYCCLKLRTVGPFKKIWVGATLFFVGLVGVLHISVAHRQRSSLLLRVVLPCMVSRNECCSRFISTQITTKTNSQQAIILFFPQLISLRKTNPLPTSLIISYPDTNLTCQERKSHFSSGLLFLS